MNITLQICGLAIISILFGIYNSQKILSLKGEKVFMNMIVLTWICIFLDALSVVVIVNKNVIANFLVQLSIKAYPISMIWVGWANLCYILLEIDTVDKYHINKEKLMIIITIIESVIIAVLPINIFANNTEVYTYGPAITATYIFTLLYIIYTLVVSIDIKFKKNSRRGTITANVMGMWIVAAIIQSLNNQLLVVGFAMALGVMTMYIVLENPDSNLDRTLGCYNSYAMHNYIDSLMEEKKEFSILDISITDEKTIAEKGINLEEVTRLVINEINEISDVSLFKNYTTGISIVANDKYKLDKVTNIMMKYLRKYDYVSDCLMLTTIEDGLRFNTESEIFKFLVYIKGKNTNRLSPLINVSEDMINQYYSIYEIEDEIKQALIEDRVEVFLQPIYSISKVKVSSAEALIRIRKKDGSLLSPALFVPVAENSGLIIELGERVLEKVCKFIRGTDIMDLGLEKIHVNLSAVQCDDNKTSKRLSNIVNAYGVDPNYISFEITETAVSQSKDILLENMNNLVKNEFTFALDDFGKGESNLMYIVEMPVSEVKLDMDMTKEYFKNYKAKVVIKSVVSMAQELNLPIVMEGIETKEEVDEVSKIGISYIQGYFYSKPLPTNEFYDYVKNFYCEKTDSLEDKENRKGENEDVHEIIQIANKHILLAEDNELSADITKDVLEDEGFTVDIASDGSMAYQMVKDSEVDTYGLILMDIRMPIMDGYEASRLIRELKNSKLANTPIIALTAQDNEEYRAQAKEAKINDFLVKPIDINKLLEIIKFD